jgi:hypothetical protein
VFGTFKKSNSKAIVVIDTTKNQASEAYQMARTEQAIATDPLMLKGNKRREIGFKKED